MEIGSFKRRFRKKCSMPLVEGVTQTQLIETFRLEWAPEHRLIIVTGNSDLKMTDDDPENLIKTTYLASSEIPVEKPPEKSLAAFPYLPIPERKGQIKTREDISDLGIVCVVFENGVQLNIKQTDYKANQVTSALIFGHGKYDEPAEKPGLAELSQKVVNLSGLGKLPRETGAYR